MHCGSVLASAVAGTARVGLMRLFGSRFCSFARILALPRQLFSYVARLNRLFSSGGAPFSWPCRACNAHEKPRCGGYGGYIWESLLPRTMTCGSSSTDDAQGSSCASSAQTSRDITAHAPRAYIKREKKSFQPWPQEMWFLFVPRTCTSWV